MSCTLTWQFFLVFFNTFSFLLNAVNWPFITQTEEHVTNISDLYSVWGDGLHDMPTHIDLNLYLSRSNGEYSERHFLREIDINSSFNTFSFLLNAVNALLTIYNTGGRSCSEYYSSPFRLRLSTSWYARAYNPIFASEYKQS